MRTLLRKLLRFHAAPRSEHDARAEEASEARLRLREQEAAERAKYKELLKREAIPLIRSQQK